MERTGDGSKLPRTRPGTCRGGARTPSDRPDAEVSSVPGQGHLEGALNEIRLVEQASKRVGLLQSHCPSDPDRAGQRRCRRCVALGRAAGRRAQER